jgi:hypothetical protein
MGTSSDELQKILFSITAVFMKEIPEPGGR